jgi:hypothetical protein
LRKGETSKVTKSKKNKVTENKEKQRNKTEKLSDQVNKNKKNKWTHQNFCFVLNHETAH